MKLPMFVGGQRHYKIDEIEGRHCIDTSVKNGILSRLPKIHK